MQADLNTTRRIRKRKQGVDEEEKMGLQIDGSLVL